MQDRRFSDEELVAYLDGEGELAPVDQIEAALKDDPALNKRLDALRIDLGVLRDSFDLLQPSTEVLDGLPVGTHEPMRRPVASVAIAACLALAVGFGLYLVLTNALFRLDGIPLPVEVISMKLRLKASPEVARNALFLRPNARCGYHVCGPADQGGVFNVESMGISTLSEHSESFMQIDEDSGEGIDPDLGYLAKIISRSDTMQDTAIVADFSDDESDVVTLSQSIEDDGRGGALYQSAEIGSNMGLFTGLGYFLTEAGPDSVRAAIDVEQGRPTPALLMATRDTPLYALARWFAARTPAARSAG